MSERKQRALTFKQANTCENATSPKYRCKCRCGGACHGIARIVSDRLAFQELPVGDPHRLDDPKQHQLF